MATGVGRLQTVRPETAISISAALSASYVQRELTWGSVTLNGRYSVVSIAHSFAICMCVNRLLN